MSRHRTSARCTASPAHSVASSTLSAYAHQNSVGDNPAGTGEGTASTASSRKDGQQRSPTYSQRCRLRTMRDASLYLTGLVALLMALPIGATSFAALCLISLTTSFIGIALTVALWRAGEA